MKLDKYMNVRRMGVTLIALMMVFSASAMVMADSEPNNDFSSADYLGTNDFETGTLDSGSDVSDYYEINLMRGDTITITLIGSGGNFDLFLYDSSEFFVKSSTSPGAIESITHTSGSDGSYYIVLRAVDGSGSYTLTTSTSTSYDPIPPSNEQFDKLNPASVPWTAGAYAASGGYMDFETIVEEMKKEMEEDMPDGVKVSINAAGGAGQYMIVEYVGPDGDNYKFDYSCRVFASIEASGTMTANNAVDESGATTDGKASGKVKVEADLLYEGSLWLGYYRNSDGTKAYWAAEKMTLDITASLDASVNADVDVSYSIMSVKGKVDASVKADMDLSLTLQSTPGIPFLPAEDKDIYVRETCKVSYTGNVKFDMKVDVAVTGDLKTLMTQYGSEFKIPEPVSIDKPVSGEFQDQFSLNYDSATKRATAPPLLNGGWAFITNVDEIELPDMGTRAYGFETTATYDPNKGMYTTYDPYMGPVDSMMPDSVDMTLKPTTKEDATTFIDNPEASLKDNGVSMPGFSGMLVVLLLVVVAVVAVVLVVVILTKKKTPKHPQPYMGQEQQMYGPQPGYEQPPPQYPPQQEYPPQQPPDQYYPPPPPQQPGY